MRCSRQALSERNEQYGYGNWRKMKGKAYIELPNGDIRFQPDGAASELADSLTVHLGAFTKGILHAEALAANKTMSALAREWVNERLGLAAQQGWDTAPGKRISMNEERLNELVESVCEGGAILRGEAEPSRTFVIEDQT